MSKNFIESALLQLKGRALEHLAAIENIMTHPVAVADHTGHVGEIMEHARKAAEYDEAVKLLQRYFVQQPARHPAPPRPPIQATVPRPAPVAPRPGGPVRPEQSPTLRKVMAAQAPKPELPKKKED